MTETEKFALFRGASFQKVTDELVGAGGRGVLAAMKERRFRASDLQASRRALSHWRDSGLMDIYGDNPDQTRLNYVELFWLHIAVELRRFGVSIEAIHKVKNTLFQNKRKPIFETYLYLLHAHKDTDFFFLVSADGRIEIGSRHEVEASEALGLLEASHIRINLNVIKNRFNRKKVEITRQNPLRNIISDAEALILEDIRNGNYKEITIHLSDGTLSRISKKTVEQNPNAIGQVRNFINSHDDFSQLSLKKANGRIVSMEVIVMGKP